MAAQNPNPIVNVVSYLFSVGGLVLVAIGVTQVGMTLGGLIIVLGGLWVWFFRYVVSHFARAMGQDRDTWYPAFYPTMRQAVRRIMRKE